MKTNVAIFVVLLAASPMAAVRAAMTSESYQIPWDAFSSGGDERGTSESYIADDTVGGIAVGDGSSASYQLKAGYRYSDQQPLSFSVAMAPIGGVTASYTALNVSTRTVTAAGAGSFSAGQLVALVETPGLGQYTAVGRISSVSGSTIQLDRLDGQAGSMSATPGSGKVYALSGGDISFGEVSAATGAVATGAISASAPTADGYTVYLQSTGDLVSADHTFAPVADGSVTVGTEEYGIRTYGAASPLSADTAVSTTALEVQSSSVGTGGLGDRVALLYRLAIGTSTPPGAYSQTMYFTLTPNY